VVTFSEMNKTAVNVSSKRNNNSRAVSNKPTETQFTSGLPKHAITFLRFSNIRG